MKGETRGWCNSTTDPRTSAKHPRTFLGVGGVTWTSWASLSPPLSVDFFKSVKQRIWFTLVVFKCFSAAETFLCFLNKNVSGPSVQSEKKAELLWKFGVQVYVVWDAFRWRPCSKTIPVHPPTSRIREPWSCVVVLWEHPLWQIPFFFPCWLVLASPVVEVVHVPPRYFSLLPVVCRKGLVSLLRWDI